MQTMDTKIDGGALAGLDYLLLDLTAHLAYNLLDTGGMDAAVGHKLMQSQTGYLATHRIEARQHDGFGGVIDDNLNAGRSL